MQTKIVNGCTRVGFLLMFLAIALSLTTLLHSGHSEAFAAQALPGEANKDVQKPLGRTVDQPGILVPFEQVEIYSRITSYVREVAVDLGDHVKKGQLLAKLDVTELDQKLEQKKAMVDKAQINLAHAKQSAEVLTPLATHSKAEIEEARAGLAQNEATAKRWNVEYERANKLLQKNVYDRQTVEEVEIQLKAAQAAELQARAKLKMAEAAQKDAEGRRDISIELANADLQLARAEAAQVNVLLQYAEIRAPFDGVVIRRLANTGTLAGPPSSANSEPMFTLARVDLMRVVVQVPEMDSVLVTKGMEATMRFQAFEGQVFKSTVARTAGTLDPRGRTLRVEIDLPNSEGRLLPGMFANVSLSPKTAPPKKNN